jgi:hypothetical protein
MSQLLMRSGARRLEGSRGLHISPVTGEQRWWVAGAV